MSGSVPESRRHNNRASRGKCLIRQSWALGEDSRAIGNNSLALGTASLAVGDHVVTRRAGSCALGRHNAASEEHLLTIGNGHVSNPYNVFAVDRRGGVLLSQVSLPTVNLCDVFACADPEIEPGDVVVIDTRTGVVERRVAHNRCKPAFGVVVMQAGIGPGDSGQETHERDVWGRYRCRNVQVEHWRPKVETRSVEACSPRLRFDNGRWVETTTHSKKVLRTVKKRQPVYATDGSILRYETLDVMERVTESIQERIPRPAAEVDPDNRVLVCFFGTAAVKADQAIPQQWINRGNAGDESLQRWFVRPT